MKELVMLKNHEAVCSSLQVAEKFRKQHKHVLRGIEQLRDLPNFGPMFKRSRYKDNQGRYQPIYYMNRDGFTLLVMGFTGKDALRWKWDYIQAFNQMEKLLTEKLFLPWQDARSLSKQIHTMETDAVKLLVEYAVSQGSKNAKRYYTIISTLANKAAGIEDGERDNATMSQLSRLILIENIISDCIQDGIGRQAPYKDIYRKSSERIQQFQTIGLKERSAHVS